MKKLALLLILIVIPLIMSQETQKLSNVDNNDDKNKFVEQAGFPKGTSPDNFKQLDLNGNAVLNAGADVPGTTGLNCDIQAPNGGKYTSPSGKVYNIKQGKKLVIENGEVVRIEDATVDFGQISGEMKTAEIKPDKIEVTADHPITITMPDGKVTLQPGEGTSIKITKYPDGTFTYERIAPDGNPFPITVDDMKGDLGRVHLWGSGTFKNPSEVVIDSGSQMQFSPPATKVWPVSQPTCVSGVQDGCNGHDNFINSYQRPYKDIHGNVKPDQDNKITQEWVLHFGVKSGKDGEPNSLLIQNEDVLNPYGAIVSELIPRGDKSSVNVQQTREVYDPNTGKISLELYNEGIFSEDGHKGGTDWPSPTKIEFYVESKIDGEIHHMYIEESEDPKKYGTMEHRLCSECYDCGYKSEDTLAQERDINRALGWKEGDLVKPTNLKKDQIQGIENYVGEDSVYAIIEHTDSARWVVLINELDENGQPYTIVLVLDQDVSSGEVVYIIAEDKIIDAVAYGNIETEKQRNKRIALEQAIEDDAPSASVDSSKNIQNNMDYIAPIDHPIKTRSNYKKGDRKGYNKYGDKVTTSHYEVDMEDLVKHTGDSTFYAHPLPNGEGSVIVIITKETTQDEEVIYRAFYEDDPCDVLECDV